MALSLGMAKKKVRRRIPEPTEANVMVLSRRKCCICFAIESDDTAKKGQIAHLDDNPSNNDLDNLCWLCMEHHDDYDSTTRQSKNYSVLEVKRYRELLYQHIAAARPNPTRKEGGAVPSPMEILSDRRKFEVVQPSTRRAMVSVRIAGTERKLEEVDEQWLREQIGRRQKEGQLVCVEVYIHSDGISIVLGTPACARGGGGGRAPNAKEAELFELWNRHKLNTNDFNFGQVEAFLKQLRHIV